MDTFINSKAPANTWSNKKQTMKKNQKERALIKHLSPDYSFSKNGIYFLIGPYGSGKSNWIFKYIMIT